MYCYLNRVDCKYATMNGCCDSTACHNMDLLANCHNLEVDTVPTQENKPQSQWHTGTPTEEGWYLLHYPKSKEQPYELAQWDGEHFVAVKPFHAIIVRIEASSVPYWQKIEED